MMRSNFIAIILLTISSLVIATPNDEVNFVSALRHGDIAKIGEMIRDGFDVSQTKCLEIAIYNNDIDTLKFLLSNGVDPKSYKHTAKAVYAAAKQNDLKFLSILVEYGANLDSEYIENKSPINTPLLQAVYNGEYDTAKKLLSLGATPDKASKKGNTALSQAVIHPTEDIATKLVTLLLDNGANPDLKGLIGYTPREMALINDRDEISFLFKTSAKYSKEVIDSLPYNISALDNQFIAKIIHSEPRYVNELSIIDALKLTTPVTTISNECAYIKAFTSTITSKPDIKISFCTKGEYSPQNLALSIQEIQNDLNKMTSRAGNHPNAEKLREISSFQAKRSQDGYAFISVKLVEGDIRFIPTAIIANKNNNVSLIVELTNNYDLDQISEEKSYVEDVIGLALDIDQHILKK